MDDLEKGVDASALGRTDGEMFWVRHQKYLLDRGYELRERYHPDWVPTRTRLKGMDLGFPFEDEIICETASLGVLDAIQVSTKRKVAIKVTRKSSPELHVAMTLGQPVLMKDERNHTVPILESFPVPGSEVFPIRKPPPNEQPQQNDEREDKAQGRNHTTQEEGPIDEKQKPLEENGEADAVSKDAQEADDEGTSTTTPTPTAQPHQNPFEEKIFMVMPYLQVFDTPKFHCRGEIAEALRQILEGIEYMHSFNIAHGDACTLNFMIDASPICPEGHHFAVPNSNDDGYTELTSIPRCRATAPIRYYLIDFEGTRQYPDGRETAREYDMRCQIKTSPEFLSEEATAFNPFPLDIYNVGASFLKLCDPEDNHGHIGVEPFRPLFESYMNPDPAQRPTASQAIQLLHDFMAEEDKDDVWLHTRVWGTRHYDPRPPLYARFVMWNFPTTTTWGYF